MGRRNKNSQPKMSYEIELDLAPLLAVMVKLVPVLLISSAFVSLMVIETDLPQAVRQAITENQENPKATIQIEISNKTGFKLITAKGGKQTAESIPNLGDGQFDLPRLHAAFVKLKTENPEVFRLELAPEATVPYKEIVRVMDEARKARDQKIKFQLFDKKENKLVTTDYMFPDVYFANMMDG